MRLWLHFVGSWKHHHGVNLTPTSAGAASLSPEYALEKIGVCAFRGIIVGRRRAVWPA